MPLYGNELSRDVTPFEAGLGRVVKFDKPGDFVGREALAARAAQGPAKHLVGLTIQSRRIPRHGYPVLADGLSFAGASGRVSGVVSPGQRIGTVTSGAPSPTLGVPIAMAFVTGDVGPDGPVLAVDIRGDAVPAQLTDLPFYSRRR
jgi:glycine cleavage system T protein (aminomethyltransferase)